MTTKKDYCTASPDSLFGVDFSEACMIHDLDYEVGGSNYKRKQADLLLKENIKSYFMVEDKKTLGSIVGNIYYAGVRIFGWMHWRKK